MGHLWIYVKFDYSHLSALGLRRVPQKSSLPPALPPCDVIIEPSESQLCPMDKVDPSECMLRG